MISNQRPSLWVESLNDKEWADVMSEAQEDYFPGLKMITELHDLNDSEISLAIDVLVPVL